MEIRLVIEDIDYESAAEVFAPLIIEHLKTETGNPFIAKTLSVSPAFAKGAAKTILSHMSQEKKDAIMVRLLNENRNRITTALENYASEKNLHFRITSAQAYK